jgi:hypothetical protein
MTLTGSDAKFEIYYIRTAIDFYFPKFIRKWSKAVPVTIDSKTISARNSDIKL